MSVVKRWRGNLATRTGLLAAARKRLKANPKSPRAVEDVKLRKRQVAHARRVIARHTPKVVASNLWGGSRAVTNEIVGIVGSRAVVTSRKRTQTFGNPGSDHHVSQRNADAVDFAIADAHWLKDEVSRKMGGPAQLPDYAAFQVRRNGHTYRVQGIAGTHGTGPHLHFGVRRVS